MIKYIILGLTITLIGCSQPNNGLKEGVTARHKLTKQEVLIVEDYYSTDTFAVVYIDEHGNLFNKMFDKDELELVSKD